MAKAMPTKLIVVLLSVMAVGLVLVGSVLTHSGPVHHIDKVVAEALATRVGTEWSEAIHFTISALLF
ncbi:MAG: hypothetical protein NTW19_19660 [Planctomycetota bacterium]|nr:hypothetical protein [Planctomycetota bacterium]